MCHPCAKSAPDLREKRQDLPPSAKLVAKTLEYEGKLTQKRLIEETLLSGRTVRKALNTLEERGLVESRVSMSDARQRLYWLTAPLREE
jgi:DNA-binding MarR family transcriptional regulator